MQDIEVEGPGGVIVVFPAGTPRDEIQRAMQARFGGGDIDRVPGDNGIYPEMLPGSSRENPIDLTTIDRSTPEGRELLARITRGMWVRGEDGTVYPLPSDPTEGQVRVGDEPVTPGVYVRPMSAVEDAAKSFPTGVVQGLTGMAGMQGTIGQMLGAEPGQYIPGFGVVGPTGEQINEEISNRFLGGEEAYQPQTVAGEYSRTAGEFLPGFAAPGGLGAKFASWLVPAVASETAGQGARLLEGGERGTALEGGARLAGGLFGGLGVGATSAVRSGADNVLRGAAEGVTPDQLAMAAALRGRSPIPLTNAEALQQVTDGATGMGRVQRVVEGASPRLAPMMANRPARVEQAIGGVLDQIAPQTPGPQVAGQAQEAATGVLDTMRRRVNESAQPFYDRLPGQSLPPEQAQQLLENPSYAAALNSVRRDPELSPLLSAEPPMDQSTRMLRAEQQGFNTQRPFYHGTRQPIEGEFRTDLTERGVLGEGMYVTRRPQLASEYAGQEGVVYPTFLRRGSVLDTTTPEGGAAFRAGESADIIRAPGQSVVRNPDAVRSTLDEFGAPTPDNDLNVINRVVQQLDTMESQARPGAMNPGGNNTLAAERSRAAALARALASEASPDFAAARQTVATGREAFVDPLRRGPIGAIAGQSDVQPNLAGQTRALFPSQPFEGQAQETAQALRLMGEVDPSVPGPLVRQFLAQQAAEAGQANVGGANPFGGAKFAAQTFGNPLQRDTVLGAVDVAAPTASRDIRDLIEALSATGQRESAGSNTSFNTQMLQDLRGGNAASGAVQGITNPLGIPGKIAGAVDDWTARRNAETLAELLMANSDEFSARLNRAINRPRGANRIRAGVALSAGQED